MNENEHDSRDQGVPPEKKKEVARDKVKLTHVETKKRALDPESLKIAKDLKEKIIPHDSFEKLSNDEMTIMECFSVSKRMFLPRIAIIANQSRVPMGKDPFKKQELEDILDKLISKGYMETQIVGDKRVYFLSERGLERIQ
ncbi:MAG: hypothetical protein BAJALOKI1v1_910009 [Promethearchaeota archaeon]|nr:MAG: hypothetical protein BAJALOKI1v1_910009 [Candidatus Lokiarchaeota archaeon]